MMSSYRKNLILSLGPIQASVDLATVAPAQKSNIHRFCPDHKVQLRQKYSCDGPEGEHTVEWGNWMLGAETVEGLKVVREEEKPKVARADALTLSPIPAKDLDASTFSGTTMYYCTPSTEMAGQTWVIIYKLLKGGKTAFITRGALRANSEKLWRLDLFRDYLVLREVVFPDVIKDVPDPVDIKVDKATQDLVTQFVDGLMTSWDKFDSTNTMKNKMDTWMLSGETIEAVEGKLVETPGLDLNAALAAAIAQQGG